MIGTSSESVAAPPESDVAMDVRPDAQQMREQLATRDGEIAGLKTELTRLRQRQAADRRAVDTLKGMLQARAALPYSLAALRPAEPPSGERAPDRSGDGHRAAPPPAPSSQKPDTTAAQELAALRAELAAERELRRRADTELQRLRRETAAGPFERGSDHALEMAQGRIAELEREVGAERRARDALASRYESSRRASPDMPNPVVVALRKEIEDLQRAHHEALVSLEQELATSRLRERALLDAVATAENGRAGPSVAALVDLRAENAALRSRLDGEYQENRMLSAKLKMATRVADLIFRMRGSQPQVPTP
ncbi:MAG: hypothetical protein A3J75_05690 [Acidobacteria bacterium RBG_16_68_9]|nr:MAG: hypothetical protein A3J75_05690 [Acidobacteria bacterium RBG_16_68_9]